MVGRFDIMRKKETGFMSEMVVELTDATFEEQIVSSKETYLVDFWAPWCGPCRLVAPIVEELASEYQDSMKVGKINVDDHQVTASKFGVMNIPTLLIFKDGELKERITGALPKPALKQAIDKALA
jgi:thioredoxin 1